MGIEKLNQLITSFTPDGEYLAVLPPSGTIKVWNTSNGSILAECNKSIDNIVSGYSCMACSFVGKKRKKERRSCLIALGTNDGDVVALDVYTGERKWKSLDCHASGLAGLCFVKKGRSLCVLGNNGMAYEVNSETGELIKRLKASKSPISSLALTCDGKLNALANGKMRMVDLESGTEFGKFPVDVGPVQHMSISDDTKTIVTSGVGDNHLQVWTCDLNSMSLKKGPVLSMPHPPASLESKSSINEEDGTLILAVSESGVAYVWNLKFVSVEGEVKPSKVTVKAKKMEADPGKNSSLKRSRTAIIAARFHDQEAERAITIAYGSTDSLQFSVVNIGKPGENFVIDARDETTTLQENGPLGEKDSHDSEQHEAVTPAQNRKANKKRAASDPDLPTTRGGDDAGHSEDMDGVLVDGDINEPTMGEKLETLKLLDDGETKIHVEGSSSPVKPPSADSVHVLLYQALHADDHALLLNCLYIKDEKVIANSVSLLNPADVLKLLHSLISIIQSRGAVLACALPWIKTLLLQHSTGIMSQDSSLQALNSVYQLIESRVATFELALEISSCLDFLYSGVLDDEVEEEAEIIPVIFEDNDEESEEDAMETDDDNKEESVDEAIEGVSDFEGIDEMR